MFAASSTSISAAGSGTMITSTLAMMATGKIRSWLRLSKEPRESADPAPQAAVAAPDAKTISCRSGCA